MHIYKKFQVNRTKIKGGCQSETKAAHCYSCTDLTLELLGLIVLKGIFEVGTSAAGQKLQLLEISGPLQFYSEILDSTLRILVTLLVLALPLPYSLRKNVYDLSRILLMMKINMLGDVQ